MRGSGQQEWERPDPNIEPAPEEVIIPTVPWDDDTPSDSDDIDSEDEDGEDC